MCMCMLALTCIDMTMRVCCARSLGYQGEGSGKQGCLSPKCALRRAIQLAGYPPIAPLTRLVVCMLKLLPAYPAATQELRGKLDASRQEVEKLETQLQEVGGQHSKELQEQEEKVRMLTVPLAGALALLHRHTAASHFTGRQQGPSRASGAGGVTQSRCLCSQASGCCCIFISFPATAPR